MMRPTTPTPALVAGLCAAFAISGCGPADAPAVTTDMAEDFDHDHEHHHGEGHDHEHEHCDGHGDGHEGTHSHPHSHSHRHGEPLHGGRIVSIGHSHHKDGATHYHAEVLAVIDGRIEFHVLTESEQGKSVDFPLGDAEVTAYINHPDGDPSLAQEVAFSKSADDDSSSKLVTDVPEEFGDDEELFVVIPKIVLGGERLHFSFTVSQREVGDEARAASADAVEETGP